MTTTQEDFQKRTEELKLALLGKFGIEELYNIYDALNTRHTSGVVVLRNAVTHLLGGHSVIADYETTGKTYPETSLAWTDNHEAGYRRIAHITEREYLKLADHFRDIDMSKPAPYNLRSFLGRENGPRFVITNDQRYVEAVLNMAEVPLVVPDGAKLSWRRAKDSISGRFTADVTEQQWRLLDRYSGEDRWHTRRGESFRSSKYVVSTIHAHSAAPASSWHIITDDMAFVETLLVKMEG
jgi:hypothetical protein